MRLTENLMAVDYANTSTRTVEALELFQVLENGGMTVETVNLVMQDA